MRANLIYDMGVHNGDDTAYYLRCGYRVIGIEANPAIIGALDGRFAAEISNGRLTLLNIGISECDGEREFWICDDHSDWSSFNREIAARNGSKHHSVVIATTTLASVLARYGVPYYCKIDIEESDQACLASLDPSDLPVYCSLEMDHACADNAINALYELGYRRFKIISQVTWTQPFPLLPRIERDLNPSFRRQLFRFDRKLRGVARDGNWHFRTGSSGAFGERTAGPWRTRGRVLKQWQMLHDQHAKHHGLSDNWFDIHAAQ